MTRIACIEVFKFSELTEEIQEKVLDKLRDINVDYDMWWDFLDDRLRDDLKEIGVEYKDLSWDLGRGSFVFMNKAYVEDEKKFLKYCGYDLRRKEARHIFDDVGIEIKTSYKGGGYGMNYILIDYEENKVMTEAINDKLNDFLKELRDTYYNFLSDESVKETIELNDFEFNKNGELWNTDEVKK